MCTHKLFAKSLNCFNNINKMYIPNNYVFTDSIFILFNVFRNLLIFLSYTRFAKYIIHVHIM